LEFRNISRVSEAITAKHMKIVPYLSATEMWPTKCTFQRCIECVDITRPQLWGIKQRSDDKNKPSYTYVCPSRVS